MLRRRGVPDSGDRAARRLRRAACCIVLAVVACRVQAQPAPDPLALPQAYPPGTTSPVPEVADELRGKELVRALRGGGYLLFMRHAQAGDTRPDCPEEAVLTGTGEVQARAVGAAMRQLRLPVAAVQVSETCRARDTGNLLGLGPVSINAALNPGSIRGRPYDFSQKFSYLLVPPPAGSNLVLVSHVHDAPTRQDRVLIELAEIVVYRARTGARAVPVARIPAGAWNALIGAAAN